ncbi:nucleotide-diphospho-sugar transferase [Metschnikowia bicuspidata var. bicuspidata NRRL YB-4993]|uniref:Nucleotide-diphospho-sugar transferase n=1 Tax=Metschnikowia bicuspidata var. bicuspidata NRRL YB-4993 TaxID=869754 RepID=A0A1A0HD75_9ASCO|nr:nucleotide-diphospho-sugar transferase [Metschnikowia bicuspidata var. bicuspidata NRRL YB-4993]OBA21883.1 nucleotide-diphospho-sugar transferase [Metschnikowia bicuspidata var. bicuspidata NRRL YB-4993]
MITRRSNLAKLAVATTIAVLVFLHVSLPGLVYPARLFSATGGRKRVAYARFFEDLDKYAIEAPLIKQKYKAEPALQHASNNADFLFSKKYLENVLDIPPETVEAFKKSHHGVVHEFIPNLLKNEKIDTFGDMRRLDRDWNSYVSSKGYVLIGGGKYSWLSYLVIQQIRAAGGQLPAELFIPSWDEYEPRFCEEILPRYNARCNVLDTDVATTLKKKFNLGGYQFKMLAVLTLRFGNVLYLDSDLFPTQNVEYLFESRLFKSKGLILWPDHWSRTTNPKFHEIAELPVGENKFRYSEYDKKHPDESGKLRPLTLYTFADSNFHDFENTLPNPSSEAGVLLINKTSHVRTMLLALYYNIYRPEYYYPLMTQGGAGEGDKETFIAAAAVLGEPYYQTKKQFKWVGYHSQDENKFVSKGLGHYDPVTATENSEDAPIVFMHCSYPKYYTDWIYNNHDLIYKDEKTHIRMYESIYENLGYDFDLRLQQIFVQGVCKDYYKDGKASDSGLLQEDEWAGAFLAYIGSDSENNEKRCREVFIPHLEWLKKTTPVFAKKETI